MQVAAPRLVTERLSYKINGGSTFAGLVGSKVELKCGNDSRAFPRPLEEFKSAIVKPHAWNEDACENNGGGERHPTNAQCVPNTPSPFLHPSNWQTDIVIPPFGVGVPGFDGFELGLPPAYNEQEFIGGYENGQDMPVSYPSMMLQDGSYLPYDWMPPDHLTACSLEGFDPALVNGQGCHGQDGVNGGGTPSQHTNGMDGQQSLEFASGMEQLGPMDQQQQLPGGVDGDAALHADDQGGWGPDCGDYGGGCQGWGVAGDGSGWENDPSQCLDGNWDGVWDDGAGGAGGCCGGQVGDNCMEQACDDLSQQEHLYALENEAMEVARQGHGIDDDRQGVGDCGRNGEMDDISRCEQGTTTVMLRNIPNKYTQDMLVRQLSKHFRGRFDFVYLPVDFKNRCNVGYGFINFRSAEACSDFVSNFNGVEVRKCLPGLNSSKVAEVTPARVQGFEENVRRLRSSPVMNELVHRPEWMPLIFDEAGEEALFPLPEARCPPVKPRRRGRMDGR